MPLSPRHIPQDIRDQFDYVFILPPESQSGRKPRRNRYAGLTKESNLEEQESFMKKDRWD